MQGVETPDPSKSSWITENETALTHRPPKRPDTMNMPRSGQSRSPRQESELAGHTQMKADDLSIAGDDGKLLAMANQLFDVCAIQEFSRSDTAGHLPSLPSWWVGDVRSLQPCFLYVGTKYQRLQTPLQMLDFRQFGQLFLPVSCTSQHD